MIQRESKFTGRNTKLAEKLNRSFMEKISEITGDGLIDVSIISGKAAVRLNLMNLLPLIPKVGGGAVNFGTIEDRFILWPNLHSYLIKDVDDAAYYSAVCPLVAYAADVRPLQHKTTGVASCYYTIPFQAVTGNIYESMFTGRSIHTFTLPAGETLSGYAVILVTQLPLIGECPT